MRGLVVDPKIEAKTQALGRELFRIAHDAEQRIPPWNRWAQQVLAWCLGDPAVKSRVLRFVDVLPSLTTPQAVVHHLHDYFPTEGLRLPPLLRAGVAVARPGLLTTRATAAAVRHLVEQMARQFLIGATSDEALAGIARLEALGMGCSLDLLGEAVTSEAEADRYVARYQTLLLQLIQATRSTAGPPLLECAGPRVNLSLKPSALTSHFNPLALEANGLLALERLRPLARLAKEHGAFLHLDMEQFAGRDVTVALAKRLLDDPAFHDAPLGLVVQAYLTDAESLVHDLLAWLKHHRATLTIRLVKGAYWDAEVVQARQHGWPEPVFLDKAATDANFERLTEVLLSHHELVRTAIASHNVRSVAHALAVAETLKVPRDRFELQLLYGMGDPIKLALVQMGYPVRVYAPYGELIPGMAYLVRRLLENTANESFLRYDYWHEATEEALLKPPRPAASPTPTPGGFQNEPVVDFARADARVRFAQAIPQMRGELGHRHLLCINGQSLETGAWSMRWNPSRPTEIVGTTAQAGQQEVELALEVASAGLASWRETAVAKRAAILRRTAQLLRVQRTRLAALEILEVGKTWREADADVCEAIDYLEYYAQQMELLDAGKPLVQVPGETNVYRYRPRGVAVVIAPWNFPAAILTGMTSAALVTGNSVIMKPSGVSSHVAAHIAELFFEAGIPATALQFLPGPGSSVGLQLVRDPRTALVLFTGSKEVGLAIAQEAAQVRPGHRHVKQVIAEMGGKNAILVDDDADLDEAVPGIVASAFGYQGQKCSACSRVIVVEAIYDATLRRLIEATDSLRVLSPEDPRCDVGPVIDEAAQVRLEQAMEQGRREGRIAYQMPRERLPRDGYFVPPTIVTDVVPRSTLAQEELFGPLVVVLRAKDFAQAVELANDVAYGLTGGVYSRSPSHLELAKAHFAVGNLYLNRKITGAVVGRQPFGGWKLSGIGTKAGGPDYLLPLLVPQTITENTTRHGLPLE